MHWSRDTEPKHPHCRHQWPITGNGNKRPAVATPMHRSSIRPTALAVTNVNFSKPRQNLSATPAQFSDSASNTHSTSVSRTEFGEQQPPKNAHFLPITQQVRIPCNDCRSCGPCRRSKLARGGDRSVMTVDRPSVRPQPTTQNRSRPWPALLSCLLDILLLTSSIYCATEGFGRLRQSRGFLTNRCRATAFVRKSHQCTDRSGHPRGQGMSRLLDMARR